MKASSLLALAVAAFLGAACSQQKEAAKKQPAPAEPSREPRVALVQLAPGGKPPELPKSDEAKTYDGNPEQIEAGHQLFQAFNCVGCHFNGGGGIGPALMDNKWIYGSSMENIASTIREGRPNGMPSFRG